MLFAKHIERLYRQRQEWALIRERASPIDIKKGFFNEGSANSLWFNGAADHLGELNLPKGWVTKPVGKLLLKLREQALIWRLQPVGNGSVDKWLSEFERVCRLIDRQLGVKSKKADWN